ncbi:hypothetical protein Tco_0968183 [Tanacetum coccineum]
MYYPRFTKAMIHHFLIQEKTLSWRNKIGMHTSKDDYLIKSLRFVSIKELTQIYEAILPDLSLSQINVQSEEPVFEVADSDLPQDQEGNLGDNEDEPRNETASRHDWFKKATPPQEPTDPD